MDQIKIGKFIAEKRKQKNLTQEKLAELLNISDRAVSKWERGINLPDASIMLEISKILEISVDELLIGETLTDNNKTEKKENALLEMKKELDEKNSKLLLCEIIIITTSIVSFLLLLTSSICFVNILWVKILLICISVLILAVASITSFAIEKHAITYICPNCQEKFNATYKQSFFSMHNGWSKYMKCPKCGKKSWMKREKNKK